MSPAPVSRRKVLRTGLQTALGGALASALPGARAQMQLPALEPLQDSRTSLVTTTENKAWQPARVYNPGFRWDTLNLALAAPADPAAAAAIPAIQGFGACFNELGWTALQQLSEADRAAVLREFFDPAAGARFSYCRMPVGANDFSTNAYSYDETDGDFNLDNFSISHDRDTLVPFLQAALRLQPALRLWASPWTPPSWMKRNGFYAEAKAYPGMRANGIRPDQVGHEGEDMFLQEPRYLQAYARYFGRFIDAYRQQGIFVGMVMPQNEFNSAQNFPSCTWTPDGLARFLHFLGPEMASRNVDIFFGTLERGDVRLLQAVMEDPEAARAITGVGIQWAGKNTLPALHREFPQLAIFQSEQECGDGTNSWSYTGYAWQLMKHYLRSGASGYMYWNMATLEGGVSTWGWPQNSLVSVDPTKKTYRFNHDFYLLKHLTHFVDVGAHRLGTTGTCDDALAFENPNGTVVALLRNELPHPQQVEVRRGDRSVAVVLAPDSISTLQMLPA